MLDFDHDTARKEVEIIDAKVLSNRKPPYPPIGGLFDALTHTKGEVLSVTNKKAQQAAKLFLETEGNDIHPAAAVAVASLIQAAKDGKIEPEAIVMLNITGGGEERFKSGKALHYLTPVQVFDINPDLKDVEIALNKIFGN
jgi:cysteate synthase